MAEAPTTIAGAAVVPGTGSGPVPADLALAARLALVLTVTVVAYRTTLLTLLESMQVDTPLAHLSLVPLISLGLAAAMRNRPSGPDIRDRQLDWIVGVPLIGVAAFMNLYLPRELSWEFWVWRVDLLSLPLFVAGAVSLVFGVRRVWKYRVAIAFLFLAWPYPYAVVLDRWLGAFTGLTIDALNLALRPLPLAAKVPSSESLFEVFHDGEAIRMSVANACSGANGLVGFLLVGGAFMFVVRGTRRGKITWLATGALLVWSFNLVRIMSIFWTARRWGEAVAIDGFHPYVGLVVFNLSVLIMMVLMPRFGLRFAGGRDRSETRAPTASAAPRSAMAVVALVISAMVVGAVNTDLRAYDRVATSLGEPRLAGFADSLERPNGWTVRETNRYDWSERFFGSDSEWIRYNYAVDSGHVGGGRTLESSLPITADVITTSNRGALSSYGVEQCYSFHGHDIAETRDVDLGNGLIGGMLTWTNVEKDLSWTTLYWHWPIRNGDDTRYERITLVMQQRAGTTFSSPSIAAVPVDDDGPAHLARQQDFLIDFGRELVTRRSLD